MNRLFCWPSVRSRRSIFLFTAMSTFLLNSITWMLFLTSSVGLKGQNFPMDVHTKHRSLKSHSHSHSHSKFVSKFNIAAEEIIDAVKASHKDHFRWFKQNEKKNRFDVNQNLIKDGSVDNSFLLSLESEWDVISFSKVPGVFLLQQASSFSCLLLFQNTCHLYMNGNTHLHNNRTGIWFSENKNVNFSGVRLKSDACTLFNTPENSNSKRVAEVPPRGEFVATNTTPLFFGVKHAPNVPEIVYLINGCDFSQAWPNETLPVNPLNGVPSVLPGFPRQHKNVDRFGKDVHDVSDLKRKEGVLYGRMSNWKEMEDYVAGSYPTSRKTFRLLLEKKQGVYDVALVPRGNADVVSFVSGGLFTLFESTESFSILKKDTEKNNVLFFPSDFYIHPWIQSISKLIFNSNLNSDAIPGFDPGKKVCFKNVLFSLNAEHGDDILNIVRKKSQEMVKESTTGQNTEETKKGLTATEEIRGFGNEMQNKLDENSNNNNKNDDNNKIRFQITIVNSTATSKVSNLVDVFEATKKQFPQLPIFIVDLFKLTFENQIHIMKRSVLVISMHGPPLANLIFMPPGTVVIEMIPYRFNSEIYRNLAIRSRILYLAWVNVWPKNSVYPNNCFVKGKVLHLGDDRCFVRSVCVGCVRDQSITGVHIRELSEILVNAQKRIGKFLALGGVWPS